MAPKKRPTKRLTGSGAAKASATAPGEAEAAAAVAAADGECVLPSDPEDVRLTLKGLVLGGDGKVDVFAYEDLVPAYAKEPPPDQHPDPEKPGVRRGERIPKGLRVWDDIRAGNSDKDGAGWVAVRSASQHEKKKEKWFNIRTCGSWRMAFLLARLQRLYWDERAAWLKQAVPVIGSGGDTGAGSGSAKGGAAGATADGEVPSGTDNAAAASGGKDDAATPPPKAKRPRAGAAAGQAAEAEEGEASKKVARRGGGQRQVAAAEKKPPAAKPQPPPADSGRALIGAATLAGSVRLQQILAARQQQQQQQQQQQEPPQQQQPSQA